MNTTHRLFWCMLCVVVSICLVSVAATDSFRAIVGALRKAPAPVASTLETKASDGETSSRSSRLAEAEVDSTALALAWKNVRTAMRLQMESRDADEDGRRAQLI